MLHNNGDEVICVADKIKSQGATLKGLSRGCCLNPYLSRVYKMLPCKMLDFIENSLEGMFLIFDLHVFSSDTILIALKKRHFQNGNWLKSK